ncbi:dehydrogenase [Chromatiales bacterium (ex Bugula neritina AB1)]|nr:dehydrogenase [Chromatiales bacterium (ex Bugula neritina AB1)]
MKKVGVIGIGNMGSGLAKNLIKAGFEVCGRDLLPHRMDAFAEMGGYKMNSSADVGRNADAVFVMVMTGDEAKEVILGDGLITTMKAGSVILLTATINASEAREIDQGLNGSDIHLIDSPVSGGYPGAQAGTLTLMAAGQNEVLDTYVDVMDAVSGTIHRVGTDIGMGQTVKACLQSLIGSIFSATFEASVLAAQAGVDAEVLQKVFNTSSAGSVITRTSLENIIDRQFNDTGSHISTMYKDLTISMDLARELGVPLFTASMAMQLFQAGITKYPDSDNWSVTKITEEIVGAELKRQN